MSDQWIGTRYSADGRNQRACAETSPLPALGRRLKGPPARPPSIVVGTKAEKHFLIAAGQLVPIQLSACRPVWECHGGPSPSPNKPSPHTAWQPATPLPSPNHSHTPKKKRKKLFQTPSTLNNTTAMEQDRLEWKREVTERHNSGTSPGINNVCIQYRIE